MKQPLKLIVPVLLSASIAATMFGVSESLSAAGRVEHQRRAAPLFLRQPRDLAPARARRRVRRASARHHRGSAILTSHFRVFRGAHATAQEVPLPANIASSLTQSGMKSEFHLQPSQARYVTVSANLHAWLVPGTDGMCLIVPESVSAGGETGTIPTSGPVGAGESCATDAKASRGELMMVLSDPETGAGTIVGVSPDGANVRATEAGSSADLAAPSNVYAVDAKGVTAIRVESGDGDSVTIPAPQP